MFCSDNTTEYATSYRFKEGLNKDIKESPFVFFVYSPQNVKADFMLF